MNNPVMNRLSTNCYYRLMNLIYVVNKSLINEEQLIYWL